MTRRRTRKTLGKIVKAPLEEGLPTSAAFASPLETPSVGGSLTSAFASTLEAPLADKVLTGETESSGSSGHSMTFEAFTLAMWALTGNRGDHGGQGNIEMMYYVTGGRNSVICGQAIDLWLGIVTGQDTTDKTQWLDWKLLHRRALAGVKVSHCFLDVFQQPAELFVLTLVYLDRVNTGQ